MPPHLPDPRSAFAVGITGHRPNRLPAGSPPIVKAEIGRLLDLVLAASAASYPAIRPVLVSGLAEGSDSLAASAALERTMPLKAILPFAVAEYEKDFKSAEARSLYRRFVSSAASVTALPGDRVNAEAAYEAAGIAMLNESHLLIAVWNGAPAAGRGGTAEMVALAAARGLPVLWIDPAGRRPGSTYKSGGSTCEQSIADALARFAGQPI